MYSSIPEFNPDSALCDSTAFTTCFLLFRTQKDIQSKKKAHCKVDLLCQRAFLSGASNRNRTCNLLITNQLHCQLCYTSGNSNIISQSAGVCQGLQQLHARIPACLYRSVIPQADLYLADMGLAQQQHAQAALANAAAHCQGQGASASTRIPILDSSSAQSSGLCQNRMSQFSVQSS